MTNLREILSKLHIDWGSLLLAFLVTCFIWVIHDFSAEYSAYFQFKVKVTTDLEGYMPSAQANETLMVRGRATGFYILRSTGRHRDPVELEVALDGHYLKPVPGSEGEFSIRVADARDRFVESLGEHIAVDFFETETLSFDFEKSLYKKVPVTASLAVTFKPQYMQVGDVELKPDSVLIYGQQKDIEPIDEVMTSAISLNLLDADAQGYAVPEQMRGIRVNADKIHYNIRVERYVEVTRQVTVQAVNVPRGKSMMLLPSQVNVTYRAPFGAKVDDESREIVFVVDYGDFSKSRNSKQIPVLRRSDFEIFSYTLEPRMVECIVADE